MERELLFATPAMSRWSLGWQVHFDSDAASSLLLLLDEGCLADHVEGNQKIALDGCLVFSQNPAAGLPPLEL